MKGIAIAKRDLLEGTAEGGAPTEPTYLSCFPDFRDDSRRTVSLQCDKEAKPPWTTSDVNLTVASGTNPASTAGAIAGKVREGLKVAVRACGADAVRGKTRGGEGGGMRRMCWCCCLRLVMRTRFFPFSFSCSPPLSPPRNVSALHRPFIGRRSKAKQCKTTRCAMTRSRAKPKTARDNRKAQCAAAQKDDASERSRRCVGSTSQVANAVFAVAHARKYLKDDEVDVYFCPEFEKEPVGTDGQERTVVLLKVCKAAGSAPVVETAP